MNTIKIIEAAKTIIPDLAEVKKDVFRGTLNIENKIAGVCYLDLKNDIKENFEEYQEKLISKEFYSNPGALQWNYYLFLLNNQLSENEILGIENDDKYARKYVLNEEEFVDFFKINETQKLTQPNIVSEWKKALEEVDLQEVYTDQTYVSVYERFASNKTIKDVAPRRSKGDGQVKTIQFINKLILKDNYRAYPKTIREFHFGKVNLIKGINGVGKTSVFEGIELMLCGKSFRNVNQPNPNGCLEAVFNNATKADLYQGTNKTIYQSRDLKWYSSTYNRGNNLYNSFNRFNYFNADAAHSFASSKTESDVMDALYSIVLGPEFGYIQERCAKMIDRIRPEYNRLKDSIDIASGQIISDKALIDAYIEPEGLKYIRVKVASDVEALGFREQDLDLTTGQTRIEDLNNQLNIALQNLAERNFQFDSKAEYDAEVERFKTKKTTFDGLLKKLKALGITRTFILEEQKQLEKNIELFETSLSYLTDPRYLELDGIAGEVLRLNAELPA